MSCLFLLPVPNSHARVLAVVMSSSPAWARHDVGSCACTIHTECINTACCADEPFVHATLQCCVSSFHALCLLCARLWTDEDNRRLVTDHYPWFLDTYDSLPKPVMKADASRYLYMHHIGGG